MTSNSRSNVVGIQTLRDQRFDKRVDEIVERLKIQQVKIEDMIATLSKCLTTVRIVQLSINAACSSASTDELRWLLEEAHIFLKDISSQLNLVRPGALP